MNRSDLINDLNKWLMVEQLVKSLVKTGEPRWSLSYPVVRERIRNLDRLIKLLDHRLLERSLDQSGSTNQVLTKLTLIDRERELLRCIMSHLGFLEVISDEVVDKRCNFEYLNIEDHHPAAQEQDCMFVNDHRLLRSQLTASQFSNNLGKQLSNRTFSLGYAFRRDRDSTHLPNFHQLEWLIMDGKDLEEFLTLIRLFLSTYLAKSVEVSIRPSYFPFTYCSFEIDVNMDGETYEIAGAGLMHGLVLRRMGLPQDKFVPAMAFGIERLIMVKYGLSNILDCYQPLS